MGGTDGINQFLSYYRNEPKTINWLPRIFTRLMHIPVYNAHILYKGVMGVTDRTEPLFNILNFTMQLVKKIVNSSPVGTVQGCRRVPT